MSDGSRDGAAVLAVDGLTVSYATRDGDVHALRAVDFAIRGGETMALVGESGSGKSTVALAIMNLLAAEARIEAGSIRFSGRDLVSLAPRERRALRGNRIAIVFQDPFTSLNPGLPIGLQVAEPLMVHRGVPEKDALDRAIAALAEVGLSQPATIARAYPHQLSGGMQQRALIAAALICDPDLVVLDEPTTALDVTVEAAILDLLDELRRRRGVAMLFITHNLGVVSRICDVVTVLYAGRVLETGPTADVLRRPAHPYTAGLLASIPRIDPRHRRARLEPIAGKFPDLIDLPSGCIFHPRCAFAEKACRETEQPLLRLGADRRVRCWKHAAIGVSARATIERPPASERVPSANSVALLDVRDLQKSYPLPTHVTMARSAIPGTSLQVPWMRIVRPKVNAVAGVSLSIGAGETLGLVGESGCGKSTLGRAIVRLIEPSAGTIRFAGRDMIGSRAHELRAFRGRAQIVFQNPVSSLNPRKTIGAAIGRALRNFGVAKRDARARVGELLEQVGLPASYAERYPHQLSGGERQRVGIARALAPRPRFIACDEPVSALDVSVQATVLNLLADLRDRLGLSYLFISHDLAVVAHIADRIAVMYAGTICEDGPTDAVLAPPYHPYTEALLSAIPSADPARRRALLARDAARGDAPLRSERGCIYAGRCARRIGSVCDDVAPPAIEAAPGHRIACHVPLEHLRAMQSADPMTLEQEFFS